MTDEMTYLDKVVLRIVGDVYQRTREPVRTIAVQARLGKGDRNCRRYLTSMERRGLVLRVGQRGGWLPVAQIEPARVATAFAELRRYTSRLEAQLAALGASPARGRSTSGCATDPVDVYSQPPLPGFDGLVRVAYLN